jgi:hypothetical protein
MSREKIFLQMLEYIVAMGETAKQMKEVLG